MIAYVVLRREWCIGDTVCGVFPTLDKAIQHAQALWSESRMWDAVEVEAWVETTFVLKWTTDKDRKVG